MSRIDQKTVEKVASLACLKLDASEVIHFQKQLDQVLNYMQQLDLAEDSLPVDWRPDLAGFLSPERLDFAVDSNVVEQVLSHAPKVAGTSFQVPKIIE